MTIDTQASTALIAALIAHLETTGKLARGDSEEVVRMATVLCRVTERPEAEALLERSIGPLIQQLIDVSETDTPPGARLKAVR